MLTSPADSEQFADLRARCKAAGIDFMRGVDFEGNPIFMASRYGYFKELPTLQAAENWLLWTTGQGKAPR